jgi:hypothetical protein
MATLTTLITAALVKLGLQSAREAGWYPRSFYVKGALDALRRDDFERAIEELGRAWRDEPGEESEVAREVILMRLDAELERIDRREAEATKLRAAAEGEITVLDLRLRRPAFRYRPTQLWVTLGAAAAVGISTAVSLLGFGLNPFIAAGGLLVFVLGAALLLAVDLRRQRAAHDTERTRIGAEVAEEIQILRAEARRRDGELAAARAERARVLALLDRLPGSPPRPGPGAG